MDRMTRIRLFVALAIIGSPIACGGGGGSSTPLTIRGAWETYVRVDCAKGFECRDSYPGTAAEFEYDYGTSVADCTTELETQEFADTVTAYEDAAANGRLTYDAAKAKTCFDAWAAQSCAPYWNGDAPSPACAMIYKGTIPTGGDCTIPGECVSATCTVPQMTCG